MRKNRVYEVVQRLTSSDENSGVTAIDVAKAADILRHNASADLNELVRKGLLHKNNERPVRFWLVNVEKAKPIHLESNLLTGNELHTESKGTLFDYEIGAKGSLRMAIEQAKAAMLYPPRGLPTLILGSTGSGKSHMAERMYRYAVQVGRLDSDAPFNVFNCADYAANPQLLLAQLFGYLKGTFTGADQTSMGLVAQSEKGVLFLDEIHRLPPEGQEMLFLLIDRGVYRMLGDGASQRRASITLIAATSEDPHSVLLKTLLRRFPVVITLPELDRRSLEERLELVEFFLGEEATRVGIPISVSPLVLVALLIFRTVGNVGELQSAVLLGCAKAFLNHIVTDVKSENMSLFLTHLAPQIQLDYLGKHQDFFMAEQLVSLEDRLYLPSRNQAKELSEKGKSADLYWELRRRVGGYLESSLQQEEIQKLIQIDVDYYLRQLAKYVNEIDRISNQFLDVVSKFIKETGKELNYVFEIEVITEIALHLASLDRMENLDMDQLLILITHCSREYEVVHRLSKQLEIGLVIKLTSAEISFLALFLASRRSKKEPEIIKVLVIAHGEHTATSMAEVANYLLAEKRVHAIDMPLSQSVEKTLQNAVQLVREMGRIKGVLLMVDMGSLTGFGVALSREMGIPVAVIPFVTTAAVIEAARLTGNNTMDLSLIVQAVKQVYDFDAVFPLQSEGKRIIITTCLTGQGTARKLAAFIIETLPEDIRNNTLVLPVDMKNGSEITSLFVEGWRGTVIAAVGTVDPHLPGVSFIGMEQILFGNGMQDLVKLAVKGDVLKANSKELIKEDALILASRFITDYIDSQDGQIFANAAILSMEYLEKVTGKPLTPSQAVRWVIHLAFALERLTTDGLVMECDDLVYLEKQHGNLLDMLEQSVFQGSQTLSIIIPRSEIGYLALIVLSE